MYICTGAALYHHPSCLCASEENPVPLCQCLPISAVIPLGLICYLQKLLKGAPCTGPSPLKAYWALPWPLL